MWTLNDGRVIQLVTLDEFTTLAHGTKLISILGEEVVVGEDPIDSDTRMGYLAYGFLVP